MSDFIKWNGKKIEADGAYSDLPIDEYHGDICVGVSVSSSGLRTIESLSPAHYWMNSIYNPDRLPELQKAHFNIGKAAHTLLLGEGGFKELYAIRPDEFDSWRTKAAKEWRERNVENGLTVLVPDDIAAIRQIANALDAHPHATDLLTGHIEKSLIWKDKETGIWLKSRPDAIPTNSDMLADLKCVASAHPDDVYRNIIKHGYHIQLALAAMGMSAVMSRKPTDCILVFAEKVPPFGVNVKPLDGELIDFGMAQIRRAIRTFADCMEKDHWPAYEQDDGRKAMAPGWFHKQMTEQQQIGELPQLEECA